MEPMMETYCNELAQRHIANAENLLREAFKSLHYAKEYIALMNRIRTTGEVKCVLDCISPPPDAIVLEKQNV